MKLRNLLLVGLTFFVNFSLDRVTKLLADAYIQGNGVIRVLGDFMLLVYARNEGAFLSLGSTWPGPLKYIVLLILPLIICLGGLLWCTFAGKRIGRIIILTTILTGGLSNIIDRIIHDFRVTDFINFGIGNLRTGILNVADLSVTFGAIALIIYEYRISRQTRTEHPSQP